MSKIFNRFKKDRAARPSNLHVTLLESSQNSVEPPTHPQPVEKIGLFELAKGKYHDEKTIDVVAVHGLQGDSYQTWTHENGTMWLESILANKIPYARIMTFGYNSTIAFSSSAAKLEDKSIELINRLSMKRSSAENGSTRPIVFICHSLGGILVKRALILAHERSSDLHYRSILNNTKAIAFLGVPHRGADAAWWFSFAASSLKGATLGASTHTALVKDLQKASPVLATISKQFIDRAKSLKIYTFYETRKLSGIVVVDEQSALLHLPNEKLFPVDANHRTICKIPSAESQEFEAVGAWIEDLVRSVATNALPNLPKLQSYFEVPNRRVSHFFGRKDIVSKIDQALSVGPGPHIAVLRGIGGQGKSQVAMEYCHQKKEDPLLDIFWIDATSQNSVTSAFISISGLLSTATDQMLDNNARIAFVSRRFASWPTRLLLVFDNYDNPHEFPNIRDFFPPNKLTSILVTGRHADIGTLVLGQGANLIELSGLEEIAAVDLLQHHSQAIETNSKFGKEIVKRLGYHPLAITQAGTYIRKGGIPLGDFMDIYKQEKEEILKNTPQLSQYRRKLGDAENETSLNVFTTWQLSFQQLLSQTSEDSVTVKLLRLLAFFDNNDISEWIFIEFHRNPFSSKISELLEWVQRFTDSQQRWKSRLFKKELILLHDFCLLQSVTQDSDEYSHASLHPLVKDWIQLQMGKPACQQFALMATQILGDILRAFWESQHFQLPLHTKQYLALHIIAQEDNNSEYLGIHCAELHQDLIVEYTKNRSFFAIFFTTLGLHKKAELLQVQVMETSKKVLGAEHLGTLASINNLALTYKNQGRWKEAELLQVQEMETSKKVLGAEHPDTLTSINNLALTYKNQGRWKEAELLQVQVMETRKEVLGAEHPGTLRSIDNLALTYQNQGRWEEAELLQVQVMETRKKVLGAEHPDTLTSISNLALTYRDQGRWEEAELLQVQVMETMKEVLGAEHPGTLTIISNLALTYRDQGRWEEAEPLQVQVMETSKKVLGAEHPDTLTSINNLALTYQDQGQWEEAELLQVQVMETRKKVLGAEHPDTLISMNNVAFMWKQRGRHLEALELMEECLRLRTRILGNSHPKTLSSSATLLEWQTENLEISGLVEESPKEEGGKEEQRQDEMKVII